MRGRATTGARTFGGGRGERRRNRPLLGHAASPEIEAHTSLSTHAQYSCCCTAPTSCDAPLPTARNHKQLYGPEGVAPRGLGLSKAHVTSEELPPRVHSAALSIRRAAQEAGSTICEVSTGHRVVIVYSDSATLVLGVVLDDGSMRYNA
eukprot:1912160-Rhodomonas_salina.1